MKKTVIAQAIEFYCSRRYKRNFNHFLKFTFMASLATFIANSVYADDGVLSQDQNNNIYVNSSSGNAGTINGGGGNVIINTDSESNISGGTANTIIGGQNLNINGSQNNLNTLLGGNNNTIDADNNGNTIGNSAIIAGQDNDIKDNSLSNAIIGGNNNTVGDSNATTTQRSVILGGDHSVVTGVGSAIVAGSTNQITNAGSTSSIVGGQNNIITGTGDPTDNNINSMSIIGGAQNKIDEAGNTGIFSGYNNTIGKNATNSVIIGGTKGHIGENAHDSISIEGGYIEGDTDSIPGAAQNSQGIGRLGRGPDGSWNIPAAPAHDSIAIGRQSTILAPNSIAIGAGSQANMMMGNPHDDKSGAAVAIGFKAKADSSNDVAIGSYSEAQRTTRTIDRVYHEAGPNPHTHVRDTVFGPERMFGNDKSDILASTSGLLGAVAVGAPGANGKEKTRQITHVAAGGDLTDAVNVAQLGAVAHFSERGFDITADKADTTKSVDTTYNTPNKNVINGDTINFTGKSGVATNFDPQQGDVVTSTTTKLTQDSAGNNIKIHTINFDLNKITDESQITANETHVISAGAAFNAIKNSKTTLTTQNDSGLKLTPTIGDGMIGNSYAINLDFPFITNHLKMNYEVNNTGNSSVSLAHGFDFTGDNNVTIKDGSNGEIQFSLNKNITVEGTVQGTTIQAGNNQLNANGLTVNNVTGLATNQIDNTGNPANGATAADAVSIGSLTSYVGNKLAGQTISYSANGQNAQTTTLSQGFNFQGTQDQTEISTEKGGVVKIGLAQKLTDTIAKNTATANAAQNTANTNAKNIGNNTQSIATNTGNIAKNTNAVKAAQDVANTNAKNISTNTNSISDNSKNLANLGKTLDTLHSAADKGIEFTTANGTKTVKLGEKVNVAGDSNIQVSANTSGLNISLNKDLNVDNITAKNTITAGSVSAKTVSATNGATLGQIHINGNKVTGLSTNQIDNTGNPSNGATAADAVSIGSLTSYVGNKLAGQTISYSANGQNAQTTTLSQGFNFQGTQDQTEISTEKGGVVKIGLAQKLTNTIAKNTATATAAQNAANTNAKNIGNNTHSITTNTGNIAKNTNAVKTAQDAANTNAKNISTNTNSISDNSKNLANLGKTLDTLHSAADKGIEFTTANGTKTVKLGEKVNVAGDSNIQVSANTSGLNISLNKDLNVDSITAKNTITAGSVSAKTVSATNGATLGQIHINGNKVTGLATNQIDNTGNPANGATAADAVSIGSLTSYVGNKLAGQTISYSANGQNAQTTTLSQGFNFQGTQDQTEISTEKGGVVKIGLAQKLTNTIAKNTATATAAQNAANTNAKNIGNNTHSITTNTGNIAKNTNAVKTAQDAANTNAKNISTNTNSISDNSKNLANLGKTLDTLHSAADKGIEFTTANGTKTVKLGEKVNVAGDSNIQVSANTSGLNISLNKDLNVDSITAKNTITAGSVSAKTVSATNGATLGQIHINGNKVTGLATNQIDNTGNPANGATAADAVSIGSLTSYVGNKLAGQTISYSANGQNAQTTTLSQGFNFQGTQDQTEISTEKGGVVKIGLAQKLTNTIAKNTATANAAQNTANTNTKNIDNNTHSITTNTGNIAKNTNAVKTAQDAANTNAKNISTNTNSISDNSKNLANLGKTLDTLHSAADKGIEFTTANGTKTVKLGEKVNIAGDSNIQVSANTSGLNISLNKDLNVDNITAKNTVKAENISATTISANNGATLGQIHINGNKITGLATNQIDNTGNPANGATAADAVSIGSLTSYVGNKLAGQTISYSANGQNAQTTTLSQGFNFQGTQDQTEISTEKGGVVKIGLAQKLTDTIAKNTATANAAQNTANTNAKNIGDNTQSIATNTGNIAKNTNAVKTAQDAANTNAQNISTNTNSISDNSKNLANLGKTLDTLHSAADKGIEFTTANGTKTVKLGEKVNVAGDSNIQVSANTSGLNISLNKDLNVDSITAKNTITAGSVSAKTVSATNGATLGQIHIDGQNITGLNGAQDIKDSKDKSAAASIGGVQSAIKNAVSGLTNQGLTFAGNTGKTKIELGNIVNIKGASTLLKGETQGANNINVTASSNGLAITLNPNVTVDGLTAKSVIIKSGGKVTGLATNQDFTNTQDAQDAASVGSVKNYVDQVLTGDKGIANEKLTFTDGKNSTSIKLGGSVNVSGDSNINVNTKNGIHISLNKNVAVDSIKAGTNSFNKDGLTANKISGNILEGTTIKGTTITASNGKLTSILTSDGLTAPKVTITNGGAVTGLSTSQFTNGTTAKGVNNTDAVSIGSVISYVGSKLANQTISYGANGQKNNQTTTFNKGFNFQQTDGETTVSVAPNGVVKIGLNQTFKQQVTTNTSNIKDLQEQVTKDNQGLHAAIDKTNQAVAQNAKDIKTNKANTDKAIDENKTAIGANKSAIGENKTAIGTNKSAIGENKTAIGANKSAIGENKTAIGENKSAIGDNKTAIGENKSAIGDNKTAIGENKSAIGENKTAIGENKSAIGENKTAIGENKSAIGDNKTAIGENKSAIGENKTAIGKNTSAIGENKTAIGANKSAISENKTAIGKNTSAIGENKTAIGANKSAIGENKTAIGENKSTIGENKTAIGKNTSGIGENKTAIGENKSAIGENKTAIGENKSAIGENKTAIGKNTSAIGENKTAIGANKSAIGENKTAIGENKSAIGENKTAIGKNTSAIGENKTAIGANKSAIGENKTAIGENKSAIGENKTAIGKNTSAIGENKTAIGENKSAIGENKTAIGKNTSAIGENKTAIGENKSAIGENKTAIGANKSAIGENKTAIGANKSAIGENKTAIGKNASTIGENKSAISANKTAIAGNTSAIAANKKATAEEINALKDQVGKNNGNLQTQINQNKQSSSKNAKAIEDNKTAAKIAEQNLQNQITQNQKSNTDRYTQLHGLIVNNQGKITHVENTIKQSNITIAKGLNFSGDQGKTVNRQLGETFNINGDKQNISTTTTANGVEVKLNDDVKVKHSLTVGNNTVINDKDGIKTNKVVTGDTTMDSNGVRVQDKTGASASISAKQGVTVHGHNGSQVTIKSNSISFSKDHHGTIHNVDVDVNDPTSVANVGYVNKAMVANAAANQALNQRMDDLDHRVNKMNKDLRGGVASAIAMGFLQTPALASQSMVSAAIGTYHSQEAVAVGYGHRSDDGKMSFKVGFSVNTRKDLGAGAGIGYAW
ncbi:hypothetical protein A6A19_06755 [Actinobacillus delphinicola]|uniref:YadA-like family protein n=1 Tax=Actinobacillus delphinicola TaxID=51161 RepID=UPI002442C7BC|nr:YadA-like family protein [Actinobacillus delphinicola]MDG6897682.1 hypothetical protein [Actinobacillus delphinicola]